MNSRLLGVLAFALAAMLIVTPSAFADGTKAGTVITNTATLTYYAGGGGSQLSEQAVAVVTVATVSSVVIDYSAVTSTTVGDGLALDIPLTIVNTGNDRDAWVLTYDEPAGLTFVGFYVDTNGDGVLDAGELSAGTIPANTTDSLDGWTYGVPATNNDSAYVIARYSTDGYLPVGTTLAPTITATSTNSTDNFTDTWTIERASLTGTKTSDHTATGSHGYEAGDLVRYSIAVTNSSDASALTAKNVLISDKLPSDVTYSAYVSGPGTVNTSADSVYWSPGDIASGASVTLVFDVSINGGVSGGTTIDNTANMAYDDDNINGTWERSENSTTSSFDVVGYGWMLSVANDTWTVFTTNAADTTVEPNNVVAYQFQLTNSGSVSDDANLTDSTSSGLWSWTIYMDGDGDGLFETGTDDVTTADFSSAVTLGAGASQIYWAVGTPNSNTTDQAVDVKSYTFTSVGNGSVTATGSHTTTVNAPAITLLKFASSSGNMSNPTTADSPVSSAAPGTSFYYIIRYANLGAADASTVIIGDPIPANLTRTPANVIEYSTDGTTWTTTKPGYIGAVTDNGTQVQFPITTLAAGTDAYVRFSVDIN